jgi:GTP cyclohydrolase I
MNQIVIETLIEMLLEQIGENPKREGLQDTPKRVAKMYQEIYRGYDESQKPKITVFPNGKDGIKYNQMICDKGYFYSQCEHHIVPLFGQYWFAYIPGKNIVGISKIARVVDYYSARLQVQERLTIQIVDELEKLLKPKGIALIMKARHLCKEMRGVKKYDSEMTTSEMRGVFLKEASTRAEFLNLIK